MQHETPIDAIYLWEVMASDRVADNSWSNIRVFVVTTTMTRVMELVLEQYSPDLRFHKIERRNSYGKQGVLVDGAVIRPQPSMLTQ